MTAKSSLAKTGPVKNDGKKGSGDQVLDGKLTAKYTLWRSKEDVAKIEKFWIFWKIMSIL